MKEVIIGLKELRDNAKKYIGEVSAGRSFTVVRRSKPIFKLVPVDNTEEAGWEPVVDFTLIKRGGINIEALLKRI